MEEIGLKHRINAFLRPFSQHHIRRRHDTTNKGKKVREHLIANYARYAIILNDANANTAPRSQGLNHTSIPTLVGKYEKNKGSIGQRGGDDGASKQSEALPMSDYESGTT